MARLEGFHNRKTFRPRLTFGSYIFTDFLSETSGKQQLFSKAFLREWRMLTGDFGRKFVKLEVAVTDVRTGGEIV